MFSDSISTGVPASCPSPLRVTPWPDPVLDVLGHDPRSWYAETFWLPTLGPTALLLMRHLADRFERTPDGVELPVADTAAALGLGARDGQQLAADAQPRPAPPVRARVHRERDDDRGAAHAPSGAPPSRPPPAGRAPGHATTNGWRANAPRRSSSPAGAPGASRSRSSRRASRSTPSSARCTRAGFHPALAHEAVRWARDRKRELDDDADLASLAMSPDPAA